MKRNVKGNGAIRQRSDGRWEARCYIDGKRKSFYGDRQTDVVKKMREAMKMHDDGIFFEPKRVTLSQWLDIWFTEYVTPSCKPHTLDAYRTPIERHIKKQLGRIKLTELTSTHIQAFCNRLHNENGLAPKTIRLIFGVLNTALNQAFKLRYISVNPCVFCTLPRTQKKEIKPLTEQEVELFLKEIQQGEPLKDLLTVALFTGMREGEICGLPWKAVDFKTGTITVRQQLCKDRSKGKAHYIDTTKNSKARTLTVAPFIMDILKRIKKEQTRNHLLVGMEWKNQFDLVFTNEIGEYIPMLTAYKHFKRIAEKIGRSDARFHDLRHTYAVTALQEGDDVKTVQENLGHATASFTLDVYGHISEKMKHESAMRIQAYFDKIKA